MKAHIIEFKDLTDSRELLEAKTPAFMSWFIYIVTAILISAVIWMWLSEIDVVVKATGVVRPTENVSIVLNVNPGTIKIVFFNEGKNVKKGDTLYKVDTTSLDLQKENIAKEKSKNDKELEMLTKLEKSINSETNLFNKSKETEYHNRYITYKLKIDQLQMSYEQAERKFRQEEKLGLSFTTKSKLTELENDYKYAEMSLDKEKSETLSNLQSEIINKENTSTKLKNDLKEIDKNIRLSNVTAPIDGIVQILKNYNTGDYIPQGVEVLKIIPGSPQDLKMEIYVQNKDIGQMKVGQEIQNRFLAFPFKEYGTIKGKVTKISGDATSDKDTGLIYKVEAVINKTVIYDKKGKEGQIKPGMMSEVRVISRKKKILYMVLEKLDFISGM